MKGKRGHKGVPMLIAVDDDSLYTDYAATTPLVYGGKEEIDRVLRSYGNPSSHYSLGDVTRNYIAQARSAVRTFITAPDEYDILFTPSGSGSNTLAVEGFLEKNVSTAYYSPTLHKSLQNLFKETRHSNIKLSVNRNGVINTMDLEEKLQLLDKGAAGTPLVVIEYANSEIGTVQPVKEIIEITHRYGGVIYIDCTGSIASIPINLKDLGADMIGFSGHKIGGLKGCGVLAKRKNIQLKPLIYGAQEDGLIGGTENVLGIVLLGRAVQWHKYINLSKESRRYIMYRLIDIGVKRLIGDKNNRLPNNFFFSVPGVNGEQLMTRLDVSYDMQVSIGSACNSFSPEPSPTLVAIGLSDEEIESCIRMTFHGDESNEEIKKRMMCLERAVRDLRKGDGE